ncbi:MAG: DsbA family protein [Deltaproteobacteria bacterium]|nr:DsbA family protein [Deltaproteobacteria bacterium]
MIRTATRAIGIAAALAFVASGCQDLKPIQGKSKGRAASSVDPGSKVKVEFYVMSKCPFGTQVEQGIHPVLDEVGDWIDFSINFIATENGDGFSALHGQPEVDGNIIQLCAMKFHPDPRDYMKFISCQNENMRAIPNGWEACADKAGLDKANISKCSKGNEGKELLRASLRQAKARNAQGSPTMFVANKPYQGGRSKNDFLRAICTEIKGNKPAACSSIPEPIAVVATVLTDKRCTKCQVDGLAANLRGRFFPKLEIKKLDYNSEEGKKLYKELGLKMLPVWLFEPGVEKAERYSQIARWMAPTGKYKQLRVPANFDPTAEICDNKIDDTGNGKIDCADATCKTKLVCREEKKNDVQVFIMSQCPFGVKAVDAMKEVLANFQGKLNFDVHYIASKTDKGFNALHGQPEVDENIRQLCAKKYHAKNNKYLDYLWCRNKNYRSNEWKACAKESGMNLAKMEKCATGPEGAKLLEEDIKIAEALEVSGSPTWLANNRFKFSGIDAERIKSSICERNPKLPNCEKKLSGPQQQRGGAAPAGSCGG